MKKLLREEVDHAMRSNEERIRLMHERAAGLQRERDRKNLLTGGSISAALFAGLLTLTFYLQGMTGYTGGQFTASSLLSDSVGGYVLVAVIFFMLGVLISVALIRYQRKNRFNEEKRRNSRDDQTVFNKE